MQKKNRQERLFHTHGCSQVNFSAPFQPLLISFIFQLLLRTTLGTKIKVKRADGIIFFVFLGHFCCSKAFLVLYAFVNFVFCEGTRFSFRLFLSMSAPQQFQLYFLKFIQNIRPTALWCYYGSIANIVDSVEKVSMVGKCLLQSVCYEVTSYFYYFANNINILTITSEIENNITGWS